MIHGGLRISNDSFDASSDEEKTTAGAVAEVGKELVGPWITRDCNIAVYALLGQFPHSGEYLSL